MRKICLLLFLLTTIPFCAQNVEYGFVSPGDYKTHNGETIGKSGIQYIKGSYQMPLMVKSDSLKGLKTLTATISGKYARLHNEGGAMAGNPHKIVNTGAMLTYSAPITRHWSLIATAGASLNAHTRYIRLQSIALTGGTIFLYRVNKNLNIGIGAIITTAYGEPVIIPTPFVTWKHNGKYSVRLDMRGLPELTLAAQLNERTRLTIAPLAVERFSALVSVDGDNKLYTQNILKSTIGITQRIGRRLFFNAEAGYTTYRRARLQERSCNAFWRDLFDGDKRFKFSPSPAISVSLTYRFK